MSYTKARVSALPKCDFCEERAEYDGKLRGFEAWAFMCYPHFYEFGIGELGLGLGQKLTLLEPESERVSK